MPDFESSMPIHHQLADSTSDWVHLENGDGDLSRRIAAAAAFAVDGSAIELADIAITQDDGDPTAVVVVIVTDDRLVLIEHEQEKSLSTRVLARSAIRSVELVKVPTIFADKQWARRGPLVVSIVLDIGESYELGSHGPTEKQRGDLETVLPKLLGTLGTAL